MQNSREFYKVKGNSPSPQQFPKVFQDYQIWDPHHFQGTRSLIWGHYFLLPLMGEADGEDGVGLRWGEGVSAVGFGLRISVS